MADPGYAPPVHLDLFLFLKSAENPESVLSKYLDAYQRFPNDGYIKKGMADLRKASDFDRLQKRARLNEYVLVPAPGKKSRSAKIRPGMRRARSGIAQRALTAAVAACLLCALLFGVYSVRGRIASFVKGGDRNDGRATPREIEMITLEKDRYDLIEKIVKARVPVFYYSNDEVYRDFTSSRALIKNGKYNEALLLLNKILSSNANFTVKERAEYLRSFVVNVEDRECSTASFAEVSRNSHLYRGMILKWEGKVANLKRKDGRLQFHLLTEYRPDDVFSGIAEVYSEKDYADMENGARVEVNGLFSAAIGSEHRIYLVARSVTRLTR
jgi:hypothetical protein